MDEGIVLAQVVIATTLFALLFIAWSFDGGP